MPSKGEKAELLTGMLVFREVVRAGSFSAAARNIGLSPSAVSRHIDRLEQGLDVVLLHRSTRNLRVTESGHDVFNVISEINFITDDLVNRIAASKDEPEGLLRITAPVTIGKLILSNTSTEFLNTYPDIKLEFNFTDEKIDIFKEKYELALRVTNTLPGNVVARKLVDIEYILVASTKPLSFKLPDHPQKLDSTPLIIPSDSFFSSNIILNSNNDSCTIISTPRLIANNSESLLDPILKGVGVGIIPSFLAVREISNGNLQRVFSDWKVSNNMPNSVYLLSHPSNMISARARVYIEFLKNFTQNELK